MNSNIERAIQSVVRIRCGSEIGTAFFVSPDTLMTARHVVSEFMLTQCPIEIFLNDGITTGVAVQLGEPGEPIDLAIIKISTSPANLVPLKLLTASFHKEQKLHTIGFPIELAECEEAFHLELRYTASLSHRYITELFIKTSDVSFFSYKGFSGSPVLNSSGSVVGILAMQEYRNLKGVAIRTIATKLTKHNIAFSDNSRFEDDSPLGLMRCQKILKSAIQKAGAKYNPRLHQSDSYLSEEIRDFLNIDIQERYSQIYEIAKEWCIKNDNLLGVKFNQAPDRDELDRILMFFDNLTYQYYGQKQEGTLPANIKNEEDVGIPLKEEFRKLLGNKRKADKRVFGIFGVAGCGKTHTSCWLAEEILKQGNHVFYCFGTDFNSHDEPEQQIINIFSHSIEDFDSIAKNALALKSHIVFFIDAMNEGPGYAYWEDNLPKLISFVNNRSNAKLIITGRQSNEGIDLILSNLDNANRLYTSYELTGFTTEEALENAKQTYAKEYKFPMSRFTDVRVDLSNPLLLMTFCKGQTVRSRFADGKYTKMSLYQDYINSKNNLISGKVDTDPKRGITIDAALKIAKYSVFHAGFSNVKRKKAFVICDRIAHRNWSQSLLHHLIDENILAERGESLPYDQQEVDFEFQNFGDVFRAKALLESNMTTDQLFSFFKTQIDAGKPENKDNLFNTITATLGLWNRSKRPDLTPDKINIFPFRILSNVLKENGDINPLIEELWLKKIRQYTISKILQHYRYLSLGFVGRYHKAISSLTMPQRDILNVQTFNRDFEIYGRDSIPYFHTLSTDNKEATFIYCLYLGWAASSSHPELRALIKRVLTKIFVENSSDVELYTNVLEAFIGVNDAYVCEVVLCSIYGALLIVRNPDFSSKCAQIIASRLYSNSNDYPRNLHVRQWAELIVEFAKSTNPLLDIDVNKNRNMTDNPLDWNNSSVNEETVFGETKNGKYLRYKLFKSHILPSDFYRYILGGNWRTHYEEFETENGDSISIDDIAHIIALEIERLGWNEDIDKIDVKDPPFDRHDNKEEKISKKYLWIAYQNIIALLSDHCVFIKEDDFEDVEEEDSDAEPSHDRIIDTPDAQKTIGNSSSWMLRGASGFDPTLNIQSYPKEDFLNISFSPDFSNIDRNLQNKGEFPEVQLHRDNWIMVDGWDGRTEYTDSKPKVIKGNLNYVYTSWIIKEYNEKELMTYIENLRYSDLPSISENRYNHLWNEYPWSKRSQYYKYRFRQTNRQTDINKAMPFSIIQLQEEMQGIEYENQPMSNAYAPGWDMMEQLKLYTAERGIIRRLDNNEIAAFNRNVSETSCGGLIVRKDLLERYLKENNYVLLTRIRHYKGISHPSPSNEEKIIWQISSPGEAPRILHTNSEDNR